MKRLQVSTKYGTHTVHRTTNDINGNPRYVISWLALSLPKYEATKQTRAAGLSIFISKKFGEHKGFSLPYTITKNSTSN